MRDIPGIAGVSARQRDLVSAGRGDEPRAWGAVAPKRCSPGLRPNRRGRATSRRLQPLVFAFLVDIKDADDEPPAIRFLQVVFVIVG